MSGFIYHYILALTVMAPNTYDTVKYEKVHTYGEDFIACDAAADEINNRIAWSPGEDGNFRLAECVPDNVLPRPYDGKPAQVAGYAGPKPPVYIPSNRYRSTIYSPSGNIHVYTRTTY